MTKLVKSSAIGLAVAILIGSAGAVGTCRDNAFMFIPSHAVEQINDNFEGNIGVVSNSDNNIEFSWKIGELLDYLFG